MKYNVWMYDVWGDEEEMWVNNRYHITELELNSRWVHECDDREMIRYLTDNVTMFGRAFDQYDTFEECVENIEVQENGSDPDFAIYFDIDGVPAFELERVR